MESTRILNSALEAVHRTILKVTDSESLPDLNLYSPLASRLQSGHDDNQLGSDSAALDRLDVDEQDDQKSEPGLQSSIRHGEQPVSTASSERGRAAEESTSAGEWFEDIAWSKEATGKEKARAPDRASSGASAQSTEEFFTGVNWDAESGEDRAADDLSMLDSSGKSDEQSTTKSGDTASFFASTNWDGDSGQDTKSKESHGSDDADEDAETFLEGMDWDGKEQSVTVEPDGEPPAHVKKLADSSDRDSSTLPANDDAIERSKKSERGDSEQDDGKE